MSIQELKKSLQQVRTRQIAAVNALGGSLAQDATLYDVLAFMKDPGLVESDSSDSTEQGGSTGAPTKVGYRVTLSSDGPDLSFCQGTYVLTEETASCTGLGRVYKNTAEGAQYQTYLYVFSSDDWGLASDTTSNFQQNYCYWAISDNPGNGSDVAFYMSSRITSQQDTPVDVTWDACLGSLLSGTVQAVVVG